MIVKCQLVTDEIGRYFPESLRDKILIANKNNTKEAIAIKVVDNYLRSSVGIVDKQVCWREGKQDYPYLGIDGQAFLIEIINGSVTQADMLRIEDNNLYVYEETDYIANKTKQIC